MENNPWDLEDDNSQQNLPNYNFTDEINDREPALIRKYPILCSIPDAQQFTSAMQGGITSVNIRKLSEEIMSMANAHARLDKELYQYKNEYNTLLAKN